MKVSLKGLLDEPRGSAWPPSARAVGCPVKSGNERDLYPQLLTTHFENRAHCGDCLGNKEEGAGNGRSVCSESSGLHARNNGADNGMQHRKVKLNLETASKSRLRDVIALMTLESLVIGPHHRPVNMSLLLAHTARQTTRVGSR